MTSNELSIDVAIIDAGPAGRDPIARRAAIATGFAATSILRKNVVLRTAGVAR